MKLSFSLSTKPAATRPDPTAPPHAFAEDSAAAADAAGGAAHFITEFDPSQTLDGPARPVAIPPIENRWRPEKRMRNLIDPASAAAAGDDDGGAAMEFEAADHGAAAGDGSGMSYGLNLRRRGNGDGGGGGGTAVSAPAPKRKSMESVTLERFREDMQILPDDREMEEFKDINIEDFGKALLAGYGWKEGQGIGRNAKEDVKVFEYVRRPGTQGFGFVAPEGMRPPGKKGRREPTPAPAPALVEDSRRTRRGEDGRVSAGQVMRVVDGRHAGLKGKVVGRSDGGVGADPSVFLELLQSGVTVSVGVDQVAELGSMEEEKCLRKLKELKIREKESSSSDHRKKESRREDRKRNNKRGGDERREEESISWLRNHIRVRIISKEFKGGRLYLKKGEVMDVVSPTTCDISMDDSREIIQGVSQELLETALPKRGGPVLVLYGKHQGVFGNLVERNTEREIGVVRDADSHQLFNVKLEQVAEYLGDPSYLGY